MLIWCSRNIFIFNVNTFVLLLLIAVLNEVMQLDTFMEIMIHFRIVLMVRRWKKKHIGFKFVYNSLFSFEQSNRSSKIDFRHHLLTYVLTSSVWVIVAGAQNNDVCRAFIARWMPLHVSVWWNHTKRFIVIFPGISIYLKSWQVVSHQSQLPGVQCLKHLFI